MTQHTKIEAAAPTTAPTQDHQHHIDNVGLRHRIAYGTSAVGDFKDPLGLNAYTVTASTVLTKRDHGKTIYVNAAGAVTITVPQTSTEAIPADFKCMIVRQGAGAVTLAVQGTDTFVGEGGTLSIPRQYGSVTIGKLTAGSPNTWIYFDNINTTTLGLNVQLLDANGNELLKFTTVAAAVNELTISNAATNNAPSVSATGGDANIDINLVPKGTGQLKMAGVEVGYMSVPQNSQSAAYTLVLTDRGKHILHPSADTTARTYTIPANASVAFPIGSEVTFVNQNGAGVITIAITTDTMRLAGAGTTGSRTLAANGIAKALKITATEWIISGTGLT